MYFLTIKAEFAAAHQLRGYRGKCENLHGHNFQIEVAVKGETLDRVGMLVDFVEVKNAINGAFEGVDHTNLNDHPFFAAPAGGREIGTNPSAENVARFLFGEVSRRLRELNPAAEVDSVTVYETDRCGATYRPS